MRRMLGPLSYVLFALLWPWLRRHPKLREGPRARFGHLPAGERRAGPCVWWHGASAGDVLALLPSLEAFRLLRPDAHHVVSALTDSGLALARERAGDGATVMPLPWDLPHVVARTLARVQPDVLVLEYTELWPNLLFAAGRRGVSLVLHNGRLAPRTRRRYRWLFALTGNWLEPFAVLLMRERADAERARALGARPQQIRVTGNSKLDHVRAGVAAAAVEGLRAALGLSGEPPVWVAGSTHEGEEAHLLAAQAALARQGSLPPPVLILAPRYAGRAPALAAQARGLGLTAHLRSELPGAAGRKPEPGDVVLLDTMGELFSAYALADVAFVGGTFVPRGGQNLLEPAAVGTPALFGPSLENFAEAAAWLDGHGGCRLAEPAALLPALCRRLGDRAAARAEGALGREVLARHAGAARTNAAAIAALCDRRAPL